MWAKKWLMAFNVDKCVIVQISLKPQYETSYILYNSKLKQVTDAKYLGVIIDSKLPFNKHVDIYLFIYLKLYSADKLCSMCRYRHVN